MSRRQRVGSSARLILLYALGACIASAPSFACAACAGLAMAMYAFRGTPYLQTSFLHTLGGCNPR